MSSCLWNDIDSYLASAVTADMGAASAYSTLKVGQILVGETLDPDHVTMPAVLIRGLTQQLAGDTPHMDDLALRIDGIVYPYQMIAVTESATVAGAKADSQELARRLRELVRTRYALGGLTATDGERVRSARLVSSEIEVRGAGGTNQGNYLGWALVEFEVVSDI